MQLGVFRNQLAKLLRWLGNLQLNAFFSKEISDVIASTQARKTKPDKRKRIVGNAGQCLTNQEALDIVEEQEKSKRKKLSGKVFNKKMRAENKQKQQQETENNRKLRLVKKQNAQRKECLCGKKQVNDKSNKDYSINCYKCGTWCCPDCLPEAFKGKVTEVYTCSSCVNVNES